MQQPPPQPHHEPRRPMTNYAVKCQPGPHPSCPRSSINWIQCLVQSCNCSHWQQNTAACFLQVATSMSHDGPNDTVRSFQHLLVNEQVVELAQLPGMGAAKHHHLLPPRDCELGHHLGPHLPSRLVVVKLCHDPGFWHHCRRCMADRPHCHTLFTYLNGLQ